MLNLYSWYVIVFKKKKFFKIEKLGDDIKRRLNWQLYEEDKLIITNENVECEFDRGVITYQESDAINIVDLNSQVYKRNNEGYSFEINFIDKSFIFTLKEKNYTLSGDLTDSFFKVSKKIVLVYSLNEERKKIIIELL